MAGAGYKAWSAGDVLTASDVNTYLMQQSVMTFAGTAARASAVAAPSEGMTSYRTDSNVLEAYDGSNWVPFTSLTPNSLTNKNGLINGSMEVWQRGTASATATLNTRNYLADRWYVNPAGASCTQAQSATVPTGSLGRYSLAVTGATSTTTVNVGQRIEASVIRQYKQQVTFSAWVYNGTGAAITPSLLVGTPAAADDFTTVTNRLTQVLASCADAAWTKVLFTFDASGYTNIANGAQVELQFASGTLNANTKSVRVTELQLEVGSAVTPFEYEPLETTLRKCQRYYYRINPSNAYSKYGVGLCTSASQAVIVVPFPVQMRAAISSTIDQNSTASKLSVYDGTATTYAGNAAITLDQANTSNCSLIFSTGATLTVSRPVILQSNNNTDSFLGFTAEL